MLLLDHDGKERVRIEGYLPNADFVAALENGLGRLSFIQKKYADAARWYNEVVNRFSRTHGAAEAMYWMAVTKYRETRDHKVLAQVAKDLGAQYPTSIWTAKAIPWLE